MYEFPPRRLFDTLLGFELSAFDLVAKYYQVFQGSHDPIFVKLLRVLGARQLTHEAPMPRNGFSSKCHGVEGQVTSDI